MTNLFDHLQAIKDDPDAIRQTKISLDGRVKGVARRIRSQIDLRNATSLIWALAFQEANEVSFAVENLGEFELSNFSSHARHLRALAAAVPFRRNNLQNNPNIESLLEDCEELWVAMMNAEMMSSFGKHTEADYTARFAACQMSSVAVLQLENAYGEQDEHRFLRLFGPVSRDIIEPKLGISVDDIQAGQQRIREIFVDRMNSLPRTLGPNPRAEFRELKPSIDRFLIYSDADMIPVLGDRTSNYFDTFSFVPGTVNHKYLTPHDEDCVRSRPFARLSDGSFMLVDVFYSVRAPLQRLTECLETDKQRARVTKIRDGCLEDDTCVLFQNAFAPDRIHRNYFLPVGSNGDLAERDILLVHDDAALAIECKAKPLRDVAEHRGNVSHIRDDAKKSIRNGYRQALSVVHAIESMANGMLALQDKDGQVLETLDCSTVQECLSIVVLDSDYGYVSTNLEPWLDPDPVFGYPWVVNRDALESILRLMNDYQDFLCFLRWRKTLHGYVNSEDEAVFAGFYLRHGPAEFPEGYGMAPLHASYGDILEAAYFKEKGVDCKVPAIEERTPPVFGELSRKGSDIKLRIDGNEVSFDDDHASKRKSKRNGACPCGSGKKFKRCCLRSERSPK